MVKRVARQIQNPILRTILIISVIIVFALIAIAYGKGFRITKDELGGNIITGTGLLVFTSEPDGARALIDGELVTATDNTINLKPGEYKIRIEKDGYFAWEKIVTITNEQVTETNALLYPKAPQLTSLTTTGIKNPVTDSENQLIFYTVASASSQLNGIYAMNTNRGIIAIGDARRQLASNLIDNFSEAKLEVSPDASQLLATIEPEGSGSARTYMVSTSEFNPSPRLVTVTAENLRAEWKIESQKLIDEKINSLPSHSKNIINKYFENPVFSPEKDKILYTASASASLPFVINPRLPSTNTSPEARNLNVGDTYIYNIKDDRNYLIRSQSESNMPKFTWHPDNRHLYYIEGNKINSIEYDGYNATTVYAGPFLNNFIVPWGDGSGIVILTSFNDPSIPPNLYKLVFK